MTSKTTANLSAKPGAVADPLPVPNPSRPNPSRSSAPTERAAEPPSASPLGANEVVAAYVRGRTNAGLSTDPRLRGMCGRYARQLLAARSWDREVLLEAVERFGATKRSPRYVNEWCSQIVVEREDREHKKHQATSESVRPDRGFRSIAAVLAQMRAA